MENSKFIKECLDKKKKGVYSIIAKSYDEKIKELGVTLFVCWLEKELSAEEGSIKINSLRGAVNRFKSIPQQKPDTRRFSYKTHPDIDRDSIEWE